LVLKQFLFAVIANILLIFYELKYTNLKIHSQGKGILCFEKWKLKILQRVTKTAHPNNTSTTYSYNPLQVIVTEAGQTREKVIDASGLQIQSTDAGGSIEYIYNPEGKVEQINSPSGSTSIEYDDYGYQKTLEDLDAGTIEYTYNAFGELQTQSDAKGNQQTFAYDNAGRVESLTWNGGESISYDYFAGNRQIKSITSSNGTRQRYEYDNLNRLKTRIDSINNDNKFTATYNYRTSGEIDNVVLNNSVTLGYTYNSYGYIDQVHTNNQLTWDANSMNKYGVVDNFTLGNQANTSISYDSYGFVDGITTVKSGSYLQNWDYNFNPATGNLTGRTGLNSSGNSVQETFTYDDLNRLLTYSIGANTNTVVYDENGLGNITNKTDVGGYDYTLGVHNVASISDPTTLMQNLPKQALEYTKFNKVSYIRDSTASLHARELFLTYGPDQQRVSTVYKIDNVVKKTKYFALGQYEKEIDSTGNTRELYYISGPDGVIAILQKMNNQDSIFYIHKDYLGSYDVISKPDGTVKERNNFDPWGRRRNPADWSYDNVSSTFFFDRGFTGHEHLDQFGLINMNGRVYDPLLAMFLSPDNNLQSPDFTQNFNRYSYCLNNPLKYTDPSGYNYMQLLNMAYEGNPIMQYGGGTSWGGVPYREDFIGIEGGVNAAYSSPCSNYQIWSSSPALQYKYSSYNEYNATQGHYVYVDHLGKVTNEKTVITTKDGSFEITLPTIEVVTEKIWISTSNAVNNGQGDGHSFMDNANFAFNAGDLYYSAKGEALHNELYWVQKNGKIRSTASIGNNYLLKRSYNLTGQLAEGAKIASRSFAYAGAAVSGINMVSDFRFANTFDFAMGMTTFIPGVGWAVSGVYFISNVAVESYTGKTIGEHLELQLNKIGQ
jgi:RHS repeat-associated protein